MYVSIAQDQALSELSEIWCLFNIIQKHLESRVAG